MMNCNCIEDLKKQVVEKVIGDTNVVTEETKVHCLEEQRFIGRPTGMSLNFEVAFRRIKNNGDPYARTGNDTMKVHCKFCPICGEPIDEEGE